MSFNKCTLPLKHHYSLVWDQIYHSKISLLLLIAPTWPQATTSLLSTNCAISMISHKWNHIVCTNLCLTPFTQHDILKFIHLIACIVSFFFNCWVIVYILDIPHFVYLVGGLLCYFYFFDYIENVAIHIHVEVIVWHTFAFLLGGHLGGESWVMWYMFNVLRTCQTGKNVSVPLCILINNA